MHLHVFIPIESLCNTFFIFIGESVGNCPPTCPLFRNHGNSWIAMQPPLTIAIVSSTCREDRMKYYQGFCVTRHGLIHDQLRFQDFFKASHVTFGCLEIIPVQNHAQRAIFILNQHTWLTPTRRFYLGISAFIFMH